MSFLVKLYFWEEKAHFYLLSSELGHKHMKSFMSCLKSQTGDSPSFFWQKCKLRGTQDSSRKGTDWLLGSRASLCASVCLCWKQVNALLGESYPWVGRSRREIRIGLFLEVMWGLGMIFTKSWVMSLTKRSRDKIPNSRLLMLTR